MDVPKLAHQFMEITGLNQVRLAKKLRVSQGTVSKWLAGSQSPNKRQWDRFLDLVRATPGTDRLLPSVTAQEVRLISWVSAGHLSDADSQVPEDEGKNLIFSDLGEGDFFALKVDGDSMNRVSPDGSVIVVNRADRDLIPGKPYVFLHKTEGTTYKLWAREPDRLEPHSWNDANKSIFIKRHRDFGVIGRVRRTVLDL